VIVFARLVVPVGWLPKPRLIGVSCTAVPIPANATFCGLAGALSVTEIAPLNDPIVVGRKVTVNVQVVPALILDPQLFVSWNGPDAPIFEMFRVPVPALVSVTVWAWLVV
jgi:hypothetical protein